MLAGAYWAVRFISSLLHAAKNIETAMISCPIDDGDGDDDGDGPGRLLLEVPLLSNCFFSRRPFSIFSGSMFIFGNVCWARICFFFSKAGISLRWSLIPDWNPMGWTSPWKILTSWENIFGSLLEPFASNVPSKSVWGMWSFQNKTRQNKPSTIPRHSMYDIFTYKTTPKTTYSFVG